MVQSVLEDYHIKLFMLIINFGWHVVQSYHDNVPPPYPHNSSDVVGGTERCLRGLLLPSPSSSSSLFISSSKRCPRSYPHPPHYSSNVVGGTKRCLRGLERS